MFGYHWTGNRLLQYDKSGENYMVLQYDRVYNISYLLFLKQLGWNVLFLMDAKTVQALTSIT